MKKFVILLFLTTLFPLIASAQWFSPKHGVIRLFKETDDRDSKTAAIVMNTNEKIFVEEVLEKGWCKVKYTNPKGQEFDCYAKLYQLRPLDDVAAEMVEAASQMTVEQTIVITWGLILAGIGLVLLFMGFLGNLRAILTLVVLALLSALEIYYITQTEGFTFYMPSVVGWKNAIIGFLCLLGFMIVQFVIWMKGLERLALSVAESQKGCGLAVASYILVVPALIYSVWTEKNEWINVYILWGFIIAQVVQMIVFLVQYRKTPFVAIAYTLTYGIGLTGIAFLAVEIFVIVCAAFFGGALLCGMLQQFAGSVAKGEFGNPGESFKKMSDLNRTGHTRGGFKSLNPE